MSGSERKNENEGEGGGGGGGSEGGGGGGWSTFWKVAGAAAATAVVAGPAAATAVVVYSVLKQPKAEQVVVEAGGSSGGGAVWTPPKVGWYKLNVDGSLLRHIQSAGCGGVLRDDSGKWLYGFAQKLEYSSSLKEHEPEIEGILKGLKWAKEKLGVTRVRKLEVESDNEGIVEKVNSWNRSKDPRIDEIRELLRSPDWEATVTSIPRSANGVADKLANIGSKNLTFDLIEFDSPPTSCIPALNNDKRLL